MTDAGILLAPWTEEQVANLRRYQEAGWVHPYTCTCGVDLEPTAGGWRCPGGCGYEQDWALRELAENGPPENPFPAFYR